LNCSIALTFWKKSIYDEIFGEFILEKCLGTELFYLEKAKNKKGKRKKKKKKIYVKRNIETTVPPIFYSSSYKIYLESIKD
jgi:hypothetical protein